MSNHDRPRRGRRNLGVGALSLFLYPALAAAGGPTPRHETLIAVPAPGPVVLDGGLGEWDLSGAVDSVYEEVLAPRFSATFAAMYSDEALYLSAHLADDTPLRNAHDPRVDPSRAWDGDCLQVRLTTDPGMPYPLDASGYAASQGDQRSKDPRIVHLMFWFFTERREGALQIEHGFDFHGAQLLTGAGAPVAFRVDPDQGGYTLEARLPWSLLGIEEGNRAPGAGDRVALTFQPLWGNAAGDKHVVTYNEFVTGPGFHFQTALGWGRLEFSPRGNLPPARRPPTAPVSSPSSRKAAMRAAGAARPSPCRRAWPSPAPAPSSPMPETSGWSSSSSGGEPRPSVGRSRPLGPCRHPAVSGRPRSCGGLPRDVRLQ